MKVHPPVAITSRLSRLSLADRLNFPASKKAIRRSLKGDKEPKSQHISITPKSAIAILPPKKVIKALYDYESQSTQELSFTKGDFFHVISREDDEDWYEACNPLIPTARGLVPVTFFETIGKNERQSRGSAGSLEQHKQQELHDSGFSDQGGHHARSESTNTTKQGAVRMSAIGKGSGAMVYGVVQYDFNAERPDELDAKAGEAIIVIAQSNPEWFVAKPIGRLGGPGLIPVSFIEIRDMSTGQAVPDAHDAVKRAGVPKVEEWKKMTAEYKNSSITLGKIESGGSGQMANDMENMDLNGNRGQNNGNDYVSDKLLDNAFNSVTDSRRNIQEAYNPHNSRTSEAQQGYYQQQQNYQQPMLAPISASIPRYCFDNDKYWYIIECQMEDGRHWELSRFYHDFYDFQIKLLTQFEDEAGNRGRQRTLPFMPGPVTHVTDAISNGRRQNLDEYVKKLLSMPPHISRCQLVRQLFDPREGDFEIDPNAMNDYRLSGGSQPSSGQDLSRTVSQQSSHGQTNNNGYTAYQPSSMGPPSGRPTHQRPNPSLNNGSQSRTDVQSQLMNRQPSSLTQVSSSSNTGAMKIKVFFQDDIIAIRVPSDINFQQLKEKLKDRLKINEDIMMQYRDEPTGGYAEILSDNDLDVALQRNPKLSLYIGVV
ncbi:bud emergence protein 1 [Arachnomyces sp. PD_36]|nr:bud emergence protein 1 [Arachnomyces sp. PD_36]